MENKFEMTQEMKEKVEELKAKLIREKEKELSLNELDGVSGGAWDGTGMPSESEALDYVLMIYRDFGIVVALSFAENIGFKKSVVQNAWDEVAKAGDSSFAEKDYESILRKMVWEQYHS